MSELINNQAHRVRTMKDIIWRLHKGESPDAVREDLKTLVRETDPREIAAMEQELMAEGMPAEQVQSMCDLHSSVLREILTEHELPEIAPGHPVDTFRRENQALREAAGELRDALSRLGGASRDEERAAELDRARHAANALMDVEKHYARKENLLFSFLERHGITGPSKVMWGKDDEVRKKLRTLSDSLPVREITAAECKAVTETAAEPALRALEEMIFKEEKILFPMALDTLTREEWGEIWQQSPQYGWCLTEPREGYAPPAAAKPPPAARIDPQEAIAFRTGFLLPEQLQGIFDALPVDLTFIDAEDCVRFFSEGPDRIFDRSKAIIGRKVQHCHPPKSVHVVEQILDDFRGGRQDVAEFWISHKEMFVHIRYIAVRGPRGDYLGTLEVTQNATRIRTLEGERRLLEYDTGTAGRQEPAEK